MLWTFIKCKDKVDTTPLEEQKKKSQLVSVDFSLT